MYDGNWKDGKKNGQGVLTRPDNKYEGEFKNDCFEGNGTKYFKNGDIYKG